MKKTFAGLSLVLALASAIVACSTPASRIENQAAVFNGYPSEVQQKIRAGEVAVGFTPEQVELSLGKPDRVFTRETTEGAAEIWAYEKSSSALSFGLGAFSGGSSSVGGGVGIGTGGNGEEDKIRVSFSKGRVTAIERAADR